MVEYFSWARRVYFIFNEILLFQYLITTGILLVLQLIDVEVKTNTGVSGSEANGRKYPKIHEFLSNSSPFKPELRVTSVVIYITVFSSIFLLHYGKYMWPKYYDLSREFLYSYMANPKQGKLMIETAMNEVIRDLIMSNSNYTSRLIGDEIMKNNKILKADPKINDSIFHYDHKKIVLKHYNWSSSLQTIPITSRNNRLTESSILSKIRKHLYVLRSENCYLDSLLYDKSSIWPKNRNQLYFDNLRRLLLLLSLPFMSCLLISIQFMGLMCHYYNKEYASTRSKYPVKSSYIPWYSFQFHYAFYLVIEDFSLPTIQLIISLYDLIQVKHSFSEKVRQFCLQKREVKNIRLKISQDQSANHHEESRRYRQQIDEMKYQCNVRSIEAYITMRYIIIQLKRIKSNGEDLLNNISIMIVAIGFCVSLVMFSGHRKGEESVLVIISFYYFITFNTTYIVFSALNFYFLTIIKFIWSMINESIMEPSINQTNNGDICSSPTKPEQCGNFTKYGRPTKNMRDPIDLDLFIITPHMFIIWSKLIDFKQSSLVDLFTFEVLGNLKLNYFGLIRFNFWLSSIFMICTVYMSSFDTVEWSKMGASYNRNLTLIH